MKPGKWKSFAAAEGEREYLALLTFLPLNKFRALPKFLKYNSQIERQLRESTGLIGYSVRAKLLKLNFWTLSVWESEAALMDFVYRLPHSEIMESLAPHMGQTKFTRWKIKGAETPPSWDEAEKRSREQ
jgi:hypothetical protein